MASTKKRYNDTAIQEPEPGTGTETAHNLCKLSHFITAGDINDNIFQGGDLLERILRNIWEFVKQERTAFVMH